jgi:hypothetical protein
MSSSEENLITAALTLVFVFFYYMCLGWITLSLCNSAIKSLNKECDKIYKIENSFYLDGDYFCTVNTK